MLDGDVESVLDGRGPRKGDHVGAWDHDLAHHSVGELEDGVDHVLLLHLDDVVLLRSGDHRPDLALVGDQQFVLERLAGEDPQDALRHPLEQGSHRVQQPCERRHRPGQPERDALGLVAGHRLRHKLPEDEHEDGDHQRAHQYAYSRVAGYLGGDVGSQRSRGQLHHQDHEQQRRQEVVGVAHQPVELLGLLDLLLDQVLHAYSAYPHQRCLRRRQEGGERDQHDEARNA